MHNNNKIWKNQSADILNIFAHIINKQCEILKRLNHNTTSTDIIEQFSRLSLSFSRMFSVIVVVDERSSMLYLLWLMAHSNVHTTHTLLLSFHSIYKLMWFLLNEKKSAWLRDLCRTVGFISMANRSLLSCSERKTAKTTIKEWRAKKSTHKIRLRRHITTKRQIYS